MFKQRLLTALLFAPILLLIIYCANRWIFASLFLLVLLGCVSEWLQLIPLKRRLLEFIFFILFLLMTELSHYGSRYWLGLGLFLWGLNLVAILKFPQSQSVWGYSWLVAAAGIFFLALFGHSIMKIYFLKQGQTLLIYLLFLVWAADSGAYVAGKKWGRHKLIPNVSPGKTVEGLIGGLLLLGIVSICGYFYFRPRDLDLWLLLALLTGVMATVGDLFVSMLKRRAKIKDTGHLIPGHGGLLDRLDSLIAASPLFYSGLYFLSQ